MADHTPPEATWNGTGSLYSWLRLHSDRRFFDAASRLHENQIEASYDKKGFVEPAGRKRRRRGDAPYAGIRIS